MSLPVETAQRPATAGVHHIRLTAGEAQAVFGLAQACAKQYGGVHDGGFLDAVGVIAHSLPANVRTVFNRAQLDDRKHAVLVEGNTVDDGGLPPTSRHWQDANGPGTEVYAFMLLLYSALLGDVIGWRAQQAGRLVTDVLPIEGFERSLVSSSSEVELGWHTEDAFSPYRADHVGLLCLRGASDAATTVAFVEPAALDDATLAVLMQPRFRIRPDDSHELAGRLAGEGREFVPLLSGDPAAPMLRVDRDYVSVPDSDPVAADAYRTLVTHLDERLYDLPLRQGDVCFLDNRNVVHGRRPFRPRYDGRDRWLKRVNVVTDLRRTRTARAGSSRIIG